MIELSDKTADTDQTFTAWRHDVNATTIISTVHIRVTPREDYMISWSILWLAFFLASSVLTWQVFRESKILRAREAADVEHGGAEAVSPADRTRCTVCFSPFAWSHSHRNSNHSLLTVTCASISFAIFCFWQLHRD